MITGKVTGDDRIIRRFKNLPNEVRNELKITIGRLVLVLHRKVVQDKLSGQVLKRRTGTLARSIQFQVAENSAGIVGRVGSRINEGKPLSYAAIHEYGGVIPAHVVSAIKGKTLKFTLSNGVEMFRKSVNIPAINMPERSYLRSSLAEMKDQIKNELEAAAIKGARK